MIPLQSIERKKARGKNVCLTMERCGQRIERKKSETPRDRERQQVMEDGLQIGNDITRGFNK